MRKRSRQGRWMSSDLDPTSCVSWRSTWHRRRSRCVAGIAASVLPVGAAFAPSASSDGLWNPASVVFGPRWGAACTSRTTPCSPRSRLRTSAPRCRGTTRAYADGRSGDRTPPEVCRHAIRESTLTMSPSPVIVAAARTNSECCSRSIARLAGCRRRGTARRSVGGRRTHRSAATRRRRGALRMPPSCARARASSSSRRSGGRGSVVRASEP